MAVTYNSTKLVTETDKDKTKLNLFYLVKRLIINLKTTNLEHNNGFKPKKFFPTKYKPLMQHSLILIADPNIKTKLKQIFKKIVTDDSLNAEDRDNKIKMGLSYVAKYLHKNGVIDAAYDLLTKLKQTSEAVVPNVLSERNLPLEYRIANLALEWNKQNKVWLSPAKQLAQELNKNFMPSFSQQRLTRPSLFEQFGEMVFIKQSEPVKDMLPAALRASTLL